MGKASLDELTRAGETNYPRWSNIKRGKARCGAEEIEILGQMFPEYALWLISGKVAPEAGQTSPELEEVRHSDSGKQSAG